MLIAVVTSVLVGLCSCTATPNASGRPDNTAMVLAEPVEPTSLDPLAGYAPDGAGKIFDGLFEHQADGSLRPVLAAGPPVPSPDGRSWTVPVRQGVTFSDGTPFTAADVLATYRAVLNPAFASPLRPDYAMLTAVDQPNSTTVRFDLAYPYLPFPNKLVLGVLPASALTVPSPVSGAAFGSKPIGTGPYLLASWTKGCQLVLKANPRYPVVLGGPPKVKTVTVDFVPDDATRAADLRVGKLDGAALAPSQADTLAKNDAYTQFNDASADLRAVALPAHGPVTGDPAIRAALNDAVDRKTMVARALDNQGTPASTPMPSALPEFIEPDATFTYNQATAAGVLQQAGWLPGPAGTRVRNGITASFTLDYPSGDTVDQTLVTLFVANAKDAGIAVTPVAVDRAQLSAKAASDAMLISAGDPFDPDLAVYSLLDSSTASSGGDPTGYVDPAVDAALEAGRHQTDPAQRDVAYRQFQRAYLAGPALVCLVFAAHTYLMRANWTGYQGVVDATFQGVTWGPWWNLAAWQPK